MGVPLLVGLAHRGFWHTGGLAHGGLVLPLRTGGGGVALMRHAVSARHCCWPLPAPLSVPSPTMSGER